MKDLFIFTLMRKAFTLWGCCIFVMLIVSCTSDIKDHVVEKPYFTKFYISPEANAVVKDTCYAQFENDSTIFLFCHDFDSSDCIVVSFEGNYERVVVDGVNQLSGVTSNDFNGALRYELYNKNGELRTYNVVIKSGNGIPRIDITTVDGNPITSKTEYTKADFRITNNPDKGGSLNASGKIRGRGNATWRCPKKPYKVKFSEKLSPFGFPENKDWVLLADFKDLSSLRTAYMCELSKAIGLDFTINYQYVDLYLNGEYEGLYLLVDQVEKSKNRVNIEKDGFLIEQDNWYESEPLSFATKAYGYNYTFKHPDANDGDIIEGDESYSFIVDFMNRLENSLLRLDDNADDVEYQKYIDTESFAKWALLAQMVCVFDPNRFYYLPDRISTLKMGPMWDMEYSLGFWTNSWGERPDPMERTDILNFRKDKVVTQYYFDRLIKSTLFKDLIRKEFFECKGKLGAINDTIDDIITVIAYSQEADFIKWKDAKHAWFHYDENDWKGETDKVKAFFKNRVLYVEEYVNSL